ncbi:hypothetical protein [Flavivirga spongiicola]|uniref:F5/8 type C domain-containing protein n=1 Tax=Flavivirga spongiicola TaxID=421621 RepID=A0ABU7XNH2_9FLAO|nr:hypothetical protein [Flavivirga sp. MEBiC05379]MDO5977301.1 hypothetical protein [Flavivirga sp. MEBiC05379]
MPAVLVDGIGVNDGTARDWPGGSEMVINLEQVIEFDEVKLGVYNGDNRTYHGVNVSHSVDGVTYFN